LEEKDAENQRLSSGLRSKFTSDGFSLESALGLIDALLST
jgi:hypothetical protein